MWDKRENHCFGLVGSAATPTPTRPCRPPHSSRRLYLPRPPSTTHRRPRRPHHCCRPPPRPCPCRRPPTHSPTTSRRHRPPTTTRPRRLAPCSHPLTYCPCPPTPRLFRSPPRPPTTTFFLHLSMRIWIRQAFFNADPDPQHWYVHNVSDVASSCWV